MPTFLQVHLQLKLIIWSRLSIFPEFLAEVISLCDKIQSQAFKKDLQKQMES